MVSLVSVDDVRPHLTGAKFDADFGVQYQRQQLVRYRNDVLVEACRGKRVLHIGCCDHAPLIAQKIASGDWLHKQISDVASAAVGVDIDGDAVLAARRISGLTNIIQGDVTQPGLSEIDGADFDVAVFGEVLEHIGNPVFFLERFVEHYGRAGQSVIVTVPNAFRGGNVRNIFRNRETINSDHRFFFTPFTLLKVAMDAGLEPRSVEAASFTKVGNPLKQLVLNRWALLAEDLILFADIAPKH